MPSRLVSRSEPVRFARVLRLPLGNPFIRCRYTCGCNNPTASWLQVQVSPSTGVATELERLVNETIPGARGVSAWQALLRAHASLLRDLATELPTCTGLTLGDFDVLAQLAGGGGELRMTDLAARAFSSRSGMTRRVDRLVEEGLVRRTGTESDARSVVVSLTDQGLERLRETVPVHLEGIRKRFVDQLSDEELEMLERVLQKVTPGLLVRLSPSPWKPHSGHRRSSEGRLQYRAPRQVTRKSLPQQVDIRREHHLVEAELEPAGRLVTSYRVLDRRHAAGVGRVHDATERRPKWLAARSIPRPMPRPRSTGPRAAPQRPAPARSR